MSLVQRKLRNEKGKETKLAIFILIKPKLKILNLQLNDKLQILFIINYILKN